MLVQWIERALKNLDEIAEYIGQDNSKAALAVIFRIVSAAAGLEQYPSSGRPGRIAGTRELVVPGTPFIVPYRVQRNEIEILRVFHGSREWPVDF